MRKISDKGLFGKAIIQSMELDAIRNNIVMPAIRRANETMPHFNLENVDATTVFYGLPGAVLDSLNLVSFVFIIEDEVARQAKKAIKITTEDVLETQTPPFANIENLCRFLQDKMAQE